MQKIQGEGMVFLEIDGSSVTYDLQAGEKLVISTGYLVSMSETCSIDVQTVKGLKNIILGGEGIFNTIITGPGRVTVQTMPLPRLANSIVPYLPTTGSGNASSGNDAVDAATSIIKMFRK